MAKRQEYTITAGVLTFTTTPVTVGGATSKETVKVTLIPADATLPHQVLTQGVDYDNDEYRVDGVADSVDSISIYWPSAADNVGATLRVEIYTDMTNPVTAQLHDFNSAGANTPKMFDEQIQQTFSIFSQIIGTGNSLGDADMGDIVQSLTRINEMAALLFTTPTLDVDSNWDGTDTFTNYATVEAMDTELDSLHSLVVSGAGLPDPVVEDYTLMGNASLLPEWKDPNVVLQTLAAYIAHEARTTVNETDIQTNADDIAAIGSPLTWLGGGNISAAGTSSEGTSDGFCGKFGNFVYKGVTPAAPRDTTFQVTKIVGGVFDIVTPAAYSTSQCALHVMPTNTVAFCKVLKVSSSKWQVALYDDIGAAATTAIFTAQVYRVP